MDEALRKLEAKLQVMARRLEELEKWVETLQSCIEAGTRTTTTHQDRHEVLNDRLDTFSARLDLLPPLEMVPCPACQDGLVFTPGDADDPPSYDHCELCRGWGEVPEGVAAYVGRLQNEVGRQRSLLTLEDLCKAQ